MSYLFNKTRTSLLRKASPEDLERRRVLRQLREFLDENEPELVYFLVNTWRTQAKAITYKELREAILRGEITAETLQAWQEDYAAFVRDHMRPRYEAAIVAAADRIHERYPAWYFDPDSEGVQEWVNERGAAFVTEVSDTQIEGLRTVILRAAAIEDMTVDQLARAIRPMVGLNGPQATANMNYFETLIENGTSEKRATDLAARYAARQHRYRGYLIARTELAFAYNQGAYFGTQQAQEAGYMGETMKIWSTADDERVCPICGALEGVKAGMNEEFTYEIEDSNGNTQVKRINPKLSRIDNPTIGLIPPAHPNCRCAVLYKEVGPAMNPATYETT